MHDWWTSEWMSVSERMNMGVNKWMNEWMNEWISDERMNGWVNEWMSESMNEWMNEWVNEWINEWVNEWMSEWMDEWWTNRDGQGLATKMVPGRCWRDFRGSLQTAVLQEALFNHLFDTGRNCLDSHLVLSSPKIAAASETKTDSWRQLALRHFHFLWMLFSGFSFQTA